MSCGGGCFLTSSSGGGGNRRCEYCTDVSHYELTERVGEGYLVEGTLSEG